MDIVPIRNILFKPINKILIPHYKTLVNDAIRNPNGTSHSYIKKVVYDRFLNNSISNLNLQKTKAINYIIQSSLYEVLNEIEYRDLGFCHLGFYNLKIKCSTDNINTASIYIGGIYQGISFFHFYKEIISSNALTSVIDVGANLGAHTLALSVLSKGMVYSYEPSNKIFAQLKENVRYNNRKNVSVKNSAIGAYSGEIGFSDSSCLKNIGLSHVDNSSSDKVQITTIDEEMRETKSSIGLIKIDTEGFELEVIKGAKETLKSNKPVIIFEYNPGSYHIEEVVESIPYDINYYELSREAYHPVRAITYNKLKEAKHSLDIILVKKN